MMQDLEYIHYSTQLQSLPISEWIIILFSAYIKLAEWVGFEPTMVYFNHAPLAGECIRPLYHHSIYIQMYDPSMNL